MVLSATPKSLLNLLDLIKKSGGVQRRCRRHETRKKWVSSV